MGDLRASELTLKSLRAVEDAFGYRLSGKAAHRLFRANATKAPKPGNERCVAIGATNYWLSRRWLSNGKRGWFLYVCGGQIQQGGPYLSGQPAFA